jgi:hypothetical protein
MIGFPVRVMAMSDKWDLNGEPLAFTIGRAAAQNAVTVGGLQVFRIMTVIFRTL